MLNKRTFKLCFSNYRENPRNALYSNHKEIWSLDDLKSVVAFDHVSAIYKDNYRKNDNFLSANCSMFDVDNTETDDEKEWISPSDIVTAFPNVPFYVCYSRNHMKAKGTKTPRPKFHIYFPDVVYNDYDAYKLHKEKVCSYFTRFDDNAKDAARFFFGVESPIVEYYDGEVLLSDFMETVTMPKAEKSFKEVNTTQDNRVPTDNGNAIYEGTRNTTMFKYACSVLKNNNDINYAHSLFIERSMDCVPLLDNVELNDIWKSALKRSSHNKPIQFNPYQWEIPPKNSEALNSLRSIDKKARKLNIATTKLMLLTIDSSIKYNEMNHQIEVYGLPKKYGNDNLVSILNTSIIDIGHTMGFKFVTEQNVQKNLDLIARGNRYHPVLELLYQKKWDNIDRIKEVYSMLGVTDSFYQTLIKKWAIQTIALLFNNSEKPISAEGVLTLQGNQGIGKTQFFRHLAIEERFFKGGATLDMMNKDSLISATSVWICELGELDSTTKKQQSSLKAFITESTDRFRAPYARTEEVLSRKTSFCGTVNPRIFLNDETGNRRFWTIPIASIDLDKIYEHDEEWYAQFWRQILVEYKKNPLGFLLSSEEKTLLNEKNKDFESLSFGEDEFFSTFNFDAPAHLWRNRTASQITDLIVAKHKHLNINAVTVGKLVSKLEQQGTTLIKRKTINGRQYIFSPPPSGE